MRLVTRGLAALDHARQLNDQARDPRERLQAAAEFFSRALAEAPRDVEARLGRAAVYAECARWHEGRGSDPLPWYGQALSDLDAAVNASGSADAHVDRAHVTGLLAVWEARGGRDAFPRFARAVQDASAALERDPRCDRALRTRLRLYELSGDASEDGASVRFYGRAIADAEERLRWWPKDAQAFEDLGLLHLKVGVRESQVDSFELAICALLSATELSPREPALWTSLGACYLLFGTALDLAGRPPRDAWELAVFAYSRALEIDKYLPAALFGRAVARIRAASLTRGRERGRLLERAHKDLASLLSRFPKAVCVHVWRARAMAMTRSHGAALRELEFAFQLGPADREVLVERVLARMARAADTSASERSRTRHYAEALVDLDRLVALDPEDGAAYALRCMVRLARGEDEGARRDRQDARRYGAADPELESLRAGAPA